MTKEERARLLYGTFVNGKCIAYDEHSEQAYIKGATEQEKINEEENGKALLYAVAKTEERVKKEMIDKACEWLLKYVRPYYKFSITDFRKTMEE